MAELKNRLLFFFKYKDLTSRRGRRKQLFLLFDMVYVIQEVLDARFNHREEIFPFQSSINKGEEDNSHSYTNKVAVCSKEKHLSLFDSGGRGLRG